MALLSLVAKLGLNSTGFEQGLNSASKRVSSFGTGLKTALAGAFSITAIGAFLRSLNQTIGRIKDLSEQFSLTTDEVQNADFALKQSGLSFEDLGPAMAKIGQARREAVEGGAGADELRKTFEKYGLTLTQLNSPQMRNFDLLVKMSEAMSRMNMTAREQSEIQDLLGHRSARLTNALANLSTTKPPTLFTQEDIDRIDRASKAMDNLGSTIQKVVAGPVARFSETLANSLEDWSKKPGPWYKKILTHDFGPGIVTRSIGAALFGKNGEDWARKPMNWWQMFSKQKPEQQAIRVDEKKQAVELRANQFPPMPQKNEDGIWQVDKNLKEVLKERATPGMSPSDQLGRIGAFSGGPSNNVSAQLKKSNDTLTAIQRVLEVRGIKIQEL